MPDDEKPETIRVAEISARSRKSFEDAVVIAVNSVGKDCRPLVVSAWVKEQSVEFDGDDPLFRVNVLISVKAGADKPLML